ncbi:MAG: FecR domain-containing protein [Bacteroidetes bacterium]|nr:FecR domain-containing protein [Bacteroidota bacterium]
MMKKVPPYAPDELLAKYLAGETSSQEQAEVENWIQKNEENRFYFQEIKASWEATGMVDEEDLKMTDMAWDSFQQKISHPQKRVLFPQWMRVAAVILVLFVSGYALINWLNQNQVTEIPVENLAETPKSLDLPDGSHIALNQHSTLTYPSQFEGKQRKVSLEGEAFFEVEANPQKPFIIQAGPIEIKVVGTSFNVRSFEKENEVIVSVNSGTVEVMDGDNKVSITQGQEAVFNKTEKTLSLNFASNPNRDSWLTGEFNFDNMPLREVAITLESAYRVNIDIGSLEIEECPIFIDNLKKSETNLAEVLKIITINHPQFNIAQTSDGFLIMGEACGP